MAAPAAFQGDYVEIRFIKTRKVAQIWVEIPIEAATAFIAAFGAPNPATTIPVAIARLDTSQAGKPKGGKLAQKAGILCSEGAFAKFLTEAKIANCKDNEDCKNAIYHVCEITSRADLDHNETAAAAFKELEASYKAWMVAG